MTLSMQEHEQALIDAIARIADLSDGESGTFHFIIHYGIFSELCRSSNSPLKKTLELTWVPNGSVLRILLIAQS